MKQITFVVHDYAGITGQDRQFQADGNYPIQRGMIETIQGFLLASTELPYHIPELGITVIEITESD